MWFLDNRFGNKHSQILFETGRANPRFYWTNPMPGIHGPIAYLVLETRVVTDVEKTRKAPLVGVSSQRARQILKRPKLGTLERMLARRMLVPRAPVDAKVQQALDRVTTYALYDLNVGSEQIYCRFALKDGRIVPQSQIDALQENFVFIGNRMPGIGKPYPITKEEKAELAKLKG